MTNVVFLGARLPLTKTIVGDVVSPYPHVSKLTSYHEKFDTLPQFFELLKKHASENHCLFNGQLAKPLKDESRAGKTLKGLKRDWLVMDFDKVACDSVEDLLPPCCKDVSYIVQKSSSMFMQSELFSGHVFFQLSEPKSEQEIKQWFEYVNFEMQFAFSLTGSTTALHWPLDRSAAFDSKLIYIAPPICRGFEPLITANAAISYVKKKKPQLTLPLFQIVPKVTIDAKINELRAQKGLPAREFNTKPFDDGEILTSAEPSVIHSVKAIGSHYIKFNIGSGDSMGYWIDLQNPYVIRNFKDEPYMLTEQVDTKFFKHLVKIAPRITAKPPLEDSTEVFAHYVTNREAMVITGLYIPGDRHLRIDTSNLSAASAWLAEYGIIAAGPPKHVDIIFDPTLDTPQYVSGYPIINSYRRTDYMVSPKKKETPSTVAELPRQMNRILRSILGDPEPAILNSFMNWLSFIFQTRTKTGTAWVMSGIEGSGKDVFVKHVLRPLFGDSAVRTEQFSLVETPFNDFLDNALFVIFNEASITAVKNDAELMMKLKHWITDSPITINAKNKAPAPRKNFANLIFYANERKPVIISDSNRRFNVAERQEKKLVFTPNEYLIVENHDELETFADILKRWPVDVEAVRALIKTETGQHMHEMTNSVNAQIAEAIREGNLQYFIDNMPSQAEILGDFGMKINPLDMYRRIIDDAILGHKVVLRDEDLYSLFRTLIPNPAFYPDGPAQRKRHHMGHGLFTKPHYDPWLKKTVRGVLVKWKIPKGQQLLTEKKKDNVLPMRTKR